METKVYKGDGCTIITHMLTQKYMRSPSLQLKYIYHKSITVPIVRHKRFDSVQPRDVKTQDALMDSLVTSSYFVGKGIILFTMFYCTLNWAHYRSIRKELEKEDDSKKKK